MKLEVTIASGLISKKKIRCHQFSSHATVIAAFQSLALCTDVWHIAIMQVLHNKGTHLIYWWFILSKQTQLEHDVETMSNRRRCKVIKIQWQYGTLYKLHVQDWKRTILKCIYIYIFLIKMKINWSNLFLSFRLMNLETDTCFMLNKYSSDIEWIQ